MLPNFTSEGLLPPGDYELTLVQLRQSHLVLRTREKGWDVAWRLQLVKNLMVMVNQLWLVGISEIFIDGSFVEDKNHPNDFDGYFVCDRQAIRTGTILNDLKQIDPVWTWAASSRSTFGKYPKPQLPMWHQHRVELFPHYGQKSGIVDADRNELDFPYAFRHSRQNDAVKGIIKIVGGS